MMRGYAVTIVLAVVGLSGCSTTLPYDCVDPTGLKCASMSEIHSRLENGTLPAQKSRIKGSEPDKWENLATATSDSDEVLAEVKPGSRIFVPPEEWRIWFAQWKDKQGDLHSESYVYTAIGHGHYQIAE